MLQSTRAAELHASGLAHLNIRNIGRCITVLSGFITLLLAPAAYAAFATPGQFEVTPTGAASYTIPIVVPPGTAGMAPSLALNYNSQGGNGLVGMGWSLSGLSAISRCPKTFIQDGVKEGISYTSADKYCLDGLRLVVSNGGAYGANATEYRTETDGFSKIVSYGAVGTTGPAYFKVWTKSGQIIEFGNTTETTDAQGQIIDARIEAQGKTAVRVWAANRISDTKGNYLTISYVEDKTNGQYYPRRIDYTGNLGNATTPALLPYNSVRFVYATKPDITPLYDGGSLIKTTVRLTNVRTYAKVNNVDTLVKDYQLIYDPNAPEPQSSRLISLKECDGEEIPVCLPPTTLQYPSANSGTFAPLVYSTQSAVGYAPGWTIQMADVNGDGKADMVGSYIGNNIGVLTSVAIAKGDGTFAPLVYSALTNVGYAPGWTIQMADVNGDGKADVVATYIGQNNGMLTSVAIGNGDGTFAPLVYSALSAIGYPAGWSIQVTDVNGDGKVDVVGSYIGRNNGWHTSVALGKGDGTFEPLVYSVLSSIGYPLGWGVQVTDVNGDGKADVVGSYVGQNNGLHMSVALGKGDGTFAPLVYSVLSGVGYPPGWKIQMADINGDGKADVAGSYIGQSNGVYTSVALGKGDGTFVPLVYSALSATGYAPGWVVQMVDVNGDGKPDVAGSYIGNNIGVLSSVAIGKGDGTFAPLVYSALTNAGYAPGWTVQMADIDGDGRADLVGSYIGQSNGVYTSVAMSTLGGGNKYLR